MNQSLLTFKKARETLIKAGVPVTRVRDLLMDGQTTFRLTGSLEYEKVSKKLKKMGLKVSASYSEDESYDSDRYSLWVRL